MILKNLPSCSTQMNPRLQPAQLPKQDWLVKPVHWFATQGICELVRFTYDRHCLHCSETEDRDHLVRFLHPPCQKWRSNLMLHLRCVLASPAATPYLVDILVDGLHSWMTHSLLDIARYPCCCHQLIHEQTAIGWRQLFNQHLVTQ
jgi:hypothetical protein